MIDIKITLNHAPTDNSTFNVIKMVMKDQFSSFNYKIEVFFVKKIRLHKCAKLVMHHYCTIDSSLNIINMTHINYCHHFC